VPLWFLVLEAAGYNPLLAQQFSDELRPEWWMRYMTYRDEKVQIDKAATRKMKRGAE
jgi:hypothetical protein